MAIYAQVAKTAVEVVKVLQVSPEEEHPAGSKTRAGPLVVAGRFYVSLIVILAAFTSVATFIDAKTNHEPSDGICLLRYVLVFAIVIGLALTVQLIWALFEKHALYLFSPTELGMEAQQALFEPRSKEQAEQTSIKAQGTTATKTPDGASTETSTELTPQPIQPEPPKAPTALGVSEKK